MIATLIALAALLALCWTSYDLDMFRQHHNYQQFLERLESMEGEYTVLDERWSLRMVVTHSRTGITVSGSGASRDETLRRLISEIEPVVETYDSLHSAA